MAQDGSFDPGELDLSLIDVDPRAYEEAQLAAAIAASLADVGMPPTISGPAASKPVDVISIGSSSGASSPCPENAHAHSSDPVQSFPNVDPAVDTQPPAFLSERAALEKARLARQKRRREEAAEENLSQTPGAGPSRTSPDGIGVLRATKQIKTYESKYAGMGRTNGGAGASRGRFWDGEIRRTPSPFNKEPTFSLPSIIGDTEDLEWAIMSAMDIDFDWVSTALPRSTPAVIISSPARNTEFKAAAVNRLTRQWVNPTPKMLPGPGVMHTKVFLLFYKSGYVRVAVNTANLLDFDWWLIENTTWVQDFPLKERNDESQSNSPDNKLADKFVESIIRMLKSMNAEAGVNTLLDEDIIQLPIKSRGLGNVLATYDFSKVKIALVASIPGKYKGAEMQTVGHTGLMRALRNIGARCHPDKQIALECQGSSIGRYSADWVESFRISAEGGGYDKWFELTPKGRKDLRYPPKERLKILFPTLATVNRVGRQCGGSLFFTPSFWDLPTFPKANFHDSNAKTGEILMHTKMILGTFVPKSSKSSASQSAQPPSSGVDPAVGGWVYIGSHNFTPSAFGTLTRPKPPSRKKPTSSKPKKNGAQVNAAGEDSDDDGEPHISMRNYELGIVIPLPANDLERAINNVVCWKRPARPYGTDVPWMQQIHLLS